MRLVTRSALFFAAGSLSLLSASKAEALVVDDASRSHGAADLSWQTRTPIVGPTSSKIGGSTLQVQISANLDPVKDPTKPMLSVDMKRVTLDATWADDKLITLAMTESASPDGIFKVVHTLAPHITLFINAFGFNLTYDYAAGDLINYVPGSQWNYVGLGAQTFNPWGFKLAIVNVNEPPLAAAQLFSIPLPNIGGGSNPLLTGNIALNATTEPNFNYVTTEVVLDGGDAINDKKPSWTIPTTDADFLDVQAQVKGKIVWSGNLYARPTVTITKIGSMTLPFPLTLEIGAAGVDLPYTSGEDPLAVVFPTTTFHIPLPNVKVLSKQLDVGSVTIGEKVTKQGQIGNTGELDAQMTLKSSNPQFVVVPSQVMKPKSKLDLDVTFTPTEGGPQSAEITVTSNDPNEPVQIIKVNGIGTKHVEPPAAPEPTKAEEEFQPRPLDTGCGCHTTAPAPSSYAAFGAIGIALGAMLRRSRRRN